MNQAFKKAAMSYMLAVLVPAIAALIGMLPVMGDHAPMTVFALAVLIPAWFGGLFPGLTATAISAALAMAAAMLLPTERIGGMALFLITGIAISLACELLHRGKRRAEAARIDVESGQQKVKESEERFRRMADSAPVFIWMTDEKGQNTWFNKAWLGFTGRSMEQEAGRGWMGGVHPDDLERCRKVWTESFRQRREFEIDYRLRSGDGRYHWVFDKGNPMMSADGTFLGFLGCCVDITERKEAEQNREAHLRVEHSARLEAERTALMKDEFLATVSHEMRTPLTAMLGWVQLLRRGNVSPDIFPQALETIERNARAQSQLIDDLLDMSRILSGRMVLAVQSVNLKDTVEAAIAAVEPSAALKGLGIRKDLAAVAMASGDQVRLQQIVWNLLSNAVKFTPAKGEIRVTLEEKKGVAEISVSDTGEGIAREFLPHVFDRFRQQDSSAARKHQGLGLGLSIVRQLAELHGGSVGVLSEGTGKGATFVVRLPSSVLAKESKVRAEPLSAISDPKVQEMVSLLGLKILVVDDDADTLELLRSILAQSGASVRTAASAEEALSRFKDRQPDVIVSDIGMPVEDGYSLIRKIRHLDSSDGGSTPALALTAFARSGDQREAIKAGFQRHLAKPVEPQELVLAISRLARE